MEGGGAVRAARREASPEGSWAEREDEGSGMGGGVEGDVVVGRERRRDAGAGRRWCVRDGRPRTTGRRRRVGRRVWACAEVAARETRRHLWVRVWKREV